MTAHNILRPRVRVMWSNFIVHTTTRKEKREKYFSDQLHFFVGILTALMGSMSLHLGSVAPLGETSVE